MTRRRIGGMGEEEAAAVAEAEAARAAAGLPFIEEEIRRRFFESGSAKLGAPINDEGDREQRSVAANRLLGPEFRAFAAEQAGAGGLCAARSIVELRKQRERKRRQRLLIIRFEKKLFF